jgi:hypothetical protein
MDRIWYFLTKTAQYMYDGEQKKVSLPSKDAPMFVMGVMIIS